MLDEWIAEIRTGDDTHYEDAIIALMPDAEKGALWVAQRHPHRRDDLVGAAYLGLVIAMENILKGSLTHDNFRGYINTIVKGHIYDFIKYDHPIIVPRDRKGEDFVYDNVAAITLPAAEVYTQEESIEILNLNPIQLRVLRLREEGHRQTVIAEILNCQRQWINEIMSAIRCKARLAINEGKF